MNTCTSSQSIEITQSNCPDFSTLSWGLGYFEASVGGGTESIFPGAAGVSSSFNAAVDGNVFAGGASCRNAGSTANYIGPACNCNLHINVTANVGALTASVTVTSAHAGALVTKNEVDLTVGIHDYPFTVPDTGGLPDSITVFIQLQTAAPAPVPRSFHFSGVVTNV